MKKIFLELVHNRYKNGVVAEYDGKIADVMFRDEEDAVTTYILAKKMLDSEYYDHEIENFFTEGDEGIVIVRLGGNVTDEPISSYGRYERQSDSEKAVNFVRAVNNFLTECYELKEEEAARKGDLTDVDILFIPLKAGK